MIRYQKDIYKEVAKRTGFKEDLVKFVVEEFWKAVHKYVREPLTCGTKIKINKVGKFFMPAKKVGENFEKSEWRVNHGRKEAKDYQRAKWFYLGRICKQLIEFDNEGQTKESINNARIGYRARKETWKRKAEESKSANNS